MNISRIAKYILIGGFSYLAWQWVGVFFVVCLFFWRRGWENSPGLAKRIENGIKSAVKEYEDSKNNSTNSTKE